MAGPVKHWPPDGRRSDWPVSMAFGAAVFCVLFALCLWALSNLTP